MKNMTQQTGLYSQFMNSNENSLFGRLRTKAGKNWTDFSCHPFVRGLGDGTLPKSCFRYYLVQDYLFLFQFARAYALAAYKAENLDELRHAITTISNIVDVEMALHVKYCARWGIEKDAISTQQEDLATTAYTRFVLDCGHRGDLLDLATALTPCVAGYAEIGHILASDSATIHEGNPYLNWIEMYASDEYQRVSGDSLAQLERLAQQRGGDARFETLSELFNQATRLETAFWDMGWNQQSL